MCSHGLRQLVDHTFVASCQPTCCKLIVKTFPQVCLVQYLGLSKEITVPCEITISLKGEKFSFYRRSSGIRLKEGRKLAICDEDRSEYVLGEMCTTREL